MRAWFLPELISEIRDVLGDDFPITTELPANQNAWLAVPVFALAKESGRTVADVAAMVATKLESVSGITTEVFGGFVNIIPQNTVRVLKEAQESGLVADLGTGKTIVIDYSQPNIAKRMSVGHLRSTIIGDALRRLYESLGYRVIGINYLGDWGTQYGKLVVAYQEKYGDLVPRKDVTIQELFDLYVQYHTDETAERDDAARAMFKRLENGDPAVMELWTFFVDISLIEYQKIYDRLAISFTEPRMGESAHRDTFEAITTLVRDAGVSEISDSAEIVNIGVTGAPFMLRKSDGATTYGTRDLAALKYRVDTYRPAAVLYVVSNEQTFHFQQVFAVARMVGIAPASIQLTHVKFGFVRLPEGKMSTRKGRVIFLDDLLDEAVRRARQVVDEKNPELTESEKSRIAEVVGVGALKYFDLSHDRKHDIVFDWDRMLQLTGDSGPYLQYSYVRATQILAKAGEAPGQIPELELPTDVQRLVRELARFPLVVQRSAQENAPHILAQYLNEVATQFSRFYELYPVLKAEKTERDVRLALVRGIAITLKRGLTLLGIEAPEKI